MQNVSEETTKSIHTETFACFSLYCQKDTTLLVILYDIQLMQITLDFLFGIKLTVSFKCDGQIT